MRRSARYSSTRVVTCLPTHVLTSLPACSRSASGYAPPSYGAAEGVPYSAAPPAAGYGSQGYAAPPGGAATAGTGGYGAAAAASAYGGGSYGYGGQPSGYEQWGYYAQ